MNHSRGTVPNATGQRGESTPSCLCVSVSRCIWPNPVWWRVPAQARPAAQAAGRPCGARPRLSPQSSTAGAAEGSNGKTGSHADDRPSCQAERSRRKRGVCEGWWWWRCRGHRLPPPPPPPRPGACSGGPRWWAIAAGACASADRQNAARNGVEWSRPQQGVWSVRSPRPMNRPCGEGAAARPARDREWRTEGRGRSYPSTTTPGDNHGCPSAVRRRLNVDPGRWRGRGDRGRTARPPTATGESSVAGCATVRAGAVGERGRQQPRGNRRRAVGLCAMTPPLCCFSVEYHQA